MYAFSIQKQDIFKELYHERGSNENLNRLLREYIPKKTSFSKLSQAELKTYVNELNDRPKKLNGFKTCREAFKRELGRLKDAEKQQGRQINIYSKTMFKINLNCLTFS